MRNPVTSILPPKGRVLIRISPPMTSLEKPIVLTISKQMLEIVSIDESAVYVVNTTERILPIFFFVGPMGFDLNWIGKITKLLKES